MHKIFSLRKFFHMALFLMAATLALMPVAAHATAPYTGTGYSFDSGTGVLTVTTDAGTTGWQSNSYFIINDAANKTNIIRVILEVGVTAINSYSFPNCSSLTSVNFPSTLASIGDGAFSGSGLTAADLSGTAVATISNNAFYNCSDLLSVSFPSTLTSIGNYAFDGSSLSDVELSGTSVITIGAGAFHDCSDLTSVSFPSTLRSIGYSAFQDNTSLATMSFAGIQAPALASRAFEGIPSTGMVSYPEVSTGYTEVYFNDATNGGSNFTGWALTADPTLNPPPPSPSPTPTPNPDPNPNPDPKPDPKPDPNPDPNPEDESGGGGCDAGLGLFGALALFAFRRRARG
jgi:MYXO-CTERM domain-containing protein